jgi:hypothetical protein
MFNLKIKKIQSGGYIMITATIFFIAISLTIIFGIVSPAIAQIKNASRSFVSRESYFLAEAGIENAIYQIKNGHTPQSSLSINGENVGINITDIDGEKRIIATGAKNNTQRKVEARLVGDTGATFNNAIFSGNGGFNIIGGSTVVGSVYSNGDITGGGGGYVTQDATSATIISPSINQSNGTIFPAPHQVTFGSNTAPQDIAQSFQVSTTTALTAIRIYIRKSTTAWMNDITLRLVTNNASNNPSSTNIATVNIPASSIPTSFGYVAITLPTAPVLTPNTTYWIVLDTGSTYGERYTIGASSNTYDGGLIKVGTHSNSWSNTSPSGLDAYFDVIVGGDTGIVSGISVGRDAWAYNISNSNVSGVAYCQIGSNNNKSCNTGRTDPSPVGYPISDQNILSWKNGVTSAISPEISGGWTYSGNLTIGSNGTTTSTLKKVVGNLTLSCNSDKPATFESLWVTGNLTTGSGCTFNVGQLKVGGNFIVGFSSINTGATEIGGSVTISSGGILTTGPIKILTDLTVGSNSLSLKGTLWVVGKMLVQSGTTVRLHSSYGNQAGIILVDDRVDLGGGGNFLGSGQTGSYPILITLSNCTGSVSCGSKNAIELSGGTGAVLLIAQNGTVNMNGGTAAKALIGYTVKLSGGAIVTYDSNLSTLNFASGSSDASNIKLWKEVE